MRRHRSNVLAVMLPLLVPALLLFPVHKAAGQKPADPKLGLSLAKRLCSSCHVIGGERRLDSMLVDAPSFVSIANKPGQSVEVIAGRIVIPHSVMPLTKLTRNEIAALSVYIFSLRDATH
jgi:mono/diheme cytochrome c family protein